MASGVYTSLAFFWRIVKVDLVIGWILAVLFYIWFLSIAGAELTAGFWIACLAALGYGFLKEQFK